MHVPWFGAARVFFFFFFATVCVWGVVVDGGSWLLLVVLHVCALTKDTPEPWMVWDARSLVVGGRLVCCSFFFFFLFRANAWSRFCGVFVVFGSWLFNCTSRMRLD